MCRNSAYVQLALYFMYVPTRYLVSNHRLRILRRLWAEADPIYVNRKNKRLLYASEMESKKEVAQIL